MEANLLFNAFDGGGKHSADLVPIGTTGFFEVAHSEGTAEVPGGMQRDDD